MRCLIVDDDAVCRKVLSVALSPLGEVVEATTGREAVESMRASLMSGQRFDLVTLDIVMPDMDGHSALVAIRALEGVKGIQPGHGAKVFMTTALGDGKNVLAAFREQCCGYMTKPIDLDRLFAQLRDHGIATN